LTEPPVKELGSFPVSIGVVVTAVKKVPAADILPRFDIFQSGPISKEAEKFSFWSEAPLDFSCWNVSVLSCHIELFFC
jgi:hypothetical protein